MLSRHKTLNFDVVMVELDTAFIEDSDGVGWKINRAQPRRGQFG